MLIHVNISVDVPEKKIQAVPGQGKKEPWQFFSEKEGQCFPRKNFLKKVLTLTLRNSLY